MKKIKGGIIYTPGGLAKEYGKLGANLYNPGTHFGCRAKCRYCSNPHGPVVRARLDEIAANEFKPRPDVLARLAKDCAGKHKGCKTPVVMGFVGDIYQPMPEEDNVTMEALSIMGAHGLVPAVLTKFGMNAVPSFPILKAAGGWFGQTCQWKTQWEDAERWEPHAASVEDRMVANRMAHEHGLKTWWSVEPVLDPKEAIRFILWLSGFHVRGGQRRADHIKLGKLSGYDQDTKRIELATDWASYRDTARDVLDRAGLKEIHEPGVFEVGTYYVKKELAEIGA